MLIADILIDSPLLALLLAGSLLLLARIAYGGAAT